MRRRKLCLCFTPVVAIRAIVVIIGDFVFDGCICERRLCC